jgi:hypothetical protein
VNCFGTGREHKLNLLCGLFGVLDSKWMSGPASGPVDDRKRPDFPSGIFIGLGLTIWSCIRQRELHIAFADFVRLQRSGRS